jgi:hypothetical protein
MANLRKAKVDSRHEVRPASSALDGNSGRGLGEPVDLFMNSGIQVVDDDVEVVSAQIRVLPIRSLRAVAQAAANR